MSALPDIWDVMRVHQTESTNLPSLQQMAASFCSPHPSVCEEDVLWEYSALFGCLSELGCVCVPSDAPPMCGISAAPVPLPRLAREVRAVMQP